MARDGNPGDHSTRRLRFDRIAGARATEDPSSSPQHSGRRVVLGAVLTVLALWAGLYLVFRRWRARYRARAAFGARQVATAIDPMVAVVPPGIDPGAWRQAVADTHTMLVALTASNLLDLAQMRALRAEVIARVARARPETARDELASLWNDLKDRAGPILSESRHPLPAILRPNRHTSSKNTGVEADASGRVPSP